MSIVKYIKNNFFGIFFLCILFLPVYVSAENVALPADKIQGFDTTLINNINNYKGGSKYTLTNRYGMGGTVSDTVISDGGDKDLFSSFQSELNVSEDKLTALKRKMVWSGTTINTNDFTTANVYTINTENTSVFIYDPTPNIPANRDEKIVAVATKTGLFLGLKSPIRKEIEGRTDQQNLDARGNDGDGFINLADSVQGVEIGTSLGVKNSIDDKTQLKIDADKQLAEAEARLKAAQEALAKNPNDPNLQAAAASADAALKQAAAKANQANINLKAAEQARADSKPTTTVSKCDGWLAFMDMGCIMERIAKSANLVLRIVSFITYIVGTLFDYSLELSINSAQFLKELGVIEIAWTFIRDILNMTFIFILLWTAIQILLGNDAKYNAKKVLTNVVIVAILINFSLFGAKLMVDASNIVTLKIYESMKAGGTKGGQKASISQRVMTAVGMSTLYNIKDVFGTDKSVGAEACADKDSAVILISVMGSIFLLVLCLALGLAGILFLIRLVNIIFLFIKSPLFVWGFILPGSKTMTDIKNRWQKEMMHVLTFPIMYMFWMFIAVLVFTQLGEAGKAQGGLLKLVCSGSADNVESSISIVAIFAIVIIFLMKTIEYGFTHVNDGGEGAIGNKFGKSMADKFSGYQTALTKGLAKKAGQGALAVGSAAGNASVGAAKGSLKFTGRLGGAAIAARSASKKGDNWWDGAKSGFFDPSIAAKEALRDAARTVTASTANSGLANALGITTAAAKIANRYNDPKNSEGKTKKEMDKERTAKAAENEKIRYDAIDKKHKVLSKKDWDKTHPTGTIDQYKQYMIDTMKLRTDAILGSGISGLTGKNQKTHIKELEERAIVEEKDASGTITGYKFNEHGMHGVMTDLIEHHTTGTGSRAIDKNKFTTFRNIKAKARIKAVSEKVKENKGKSFDKKQMQDKKVDYENEIKKIKEKVDKYPDETSISGICSNYTVYSGDGSNTKPMQKLNTAIIAYNQVNGMSTPDPTRLANAQKAIDDAKKEYVEYYNKQKSSLIRAEDRYNEHLKKIEEAENK